MRITEHFRQRLEGGLSEIVRPNDIIKACEGLTPQVGETWVLIKRFQEEVCVYNCGKVVNGDTLWVVIKKQHVADDPALVTILLRRWAQGVKEGRHFYECPSVDKGV
jgi:hypothetical protein